MRTSQQAGWQRSISVQVLIPLKFLRRNCSVCQQMRGRGSWLFIHLMLLTFMEMSFWFFAISKAHIRRDLFVEREVLCYLKNNLVPILKRKRKKRGLKNNKMRFLYCYNTRGRALFQCLCNLHVILSWWSLCGQRKQATKQHTISEPRDPFEEPDAYSFKILHL